MGILRNPKRPLWELRDPHPVPRPPQARWPTRESVQSVGNSNKVEGPPCVQTPPKAPGPLIQILIDYIYLYLAKGLRGLWAHLYTRGTFNFAAIYYTLDTFACLPPRLGRSWDRMGDPELPKGSFGIPKGFYFKHVGVFATSFGAVVGPDGGPRASKGVFWDPKGGFKVI